MKIVFMGTPDFAVPSLHALTEAGYVGEDVENILLKIIQAADYDIERAQYGIIYIDEIDKITRRKKRWNMESRCISRCASARMRHFLRN